MILMVYIAGAFSTLMWTLGQDYDKETVSVPTRMLGNVLVSLSWPLFWFTVAVTWFNEW